MALAHGYNSWIGYAEETTYGTPVAATKFLEIESESLKCERKLNVIPLLGHVSQRRTVKSKTNVSGAFRAPFLWNGTERFLKHALGSVSTTGPTLGFYDHSFTLAASLPTGLTLEASRDDAAITGNAAFQYAGCKISKLTLTQEMEQPLMMDVEILGSSMTLIAATSKTFPTYNAIDYAQVSGAAVGSDNLPLRSWKLTIDNALHEDQYRLGNHIRSGISRGGQRKVSFEAEIEYESLTFYNHYKDLDSPSAGIDYDDGTGQAFQIAFSKVAFIGDEPKSGDSGPFYITMKADCLASSADGDEMSIALTNTTSSV